MTREELKNEILKYVIEQTVSEFLLHVEECGLRTAFMVACSDVRMAILRGTKDEDKFYAVCGKRAVADEKTLSAALKYIRNSNDKNVLERVCDDIAYKLEKHNMIIEDN